ncbi:hypothetical protein A675_03300 [Salmonella enterica subsp. enterica serovar Enteritidis str. 2009K1726]|nr:hypothetical protein A672_00049 [Salmonella enterica subsp. enterica serovar Enteritidis str. 08-1080]EPI83524.1 hypothetical protein A675_03300 [Salmonella enterica subsp. enterica serovar Enteritidis str. 2009K1726]EPI97658.1 hypothetical protein A679_03523 [Salmonella enterica subsp. enterica serovar Enteritidis str. 2010K-0284]EPJ03547.1 hypothetical protein A677_00696 [Salmonella enterica subsp. enterica serovar Enteritidis str. 2010K-0267]EPJ11876.1 hypothetical protein A680_00968 [Sal
MSIFTLFTRSYTQYPMFIWVDIYYMTSYEIPDATLKRSKQHVNK